MFIDKEDIKSSETQQCYHCGSDCKEKIHYDQQLFCCNGCVAVYQLLSDHDLNEYYHFESQPGKKPNEKQGQFEWLKEKEVEESLYTFHEKNKAMVIIHLPEIHCSACIYLLENLRKVNKGVLSVEVNFTKKRAKILFENNVISLFELAVLLQKIGYTAVFQKEPKEKLKTTDQLIKKLTVAGFFFGNIMLLSFPEYLGGDQLEDQFGKFFGYLMLILSLPVLLYSSSLYLSSAIKGIKNKALNLDIPIAIGILALFGRSTYEILSQTGAGYFDSFTGFVFFLLLGRWFQNKTYAFIDFEKDIKNHLPLAVQMVKGNRVQYVPIEQLKEGNTVVLKNNEIIPADGILASRSASFDLSFITGESEPVEKKQGDKIYAGSKNVGKKSYLKLLSNIDHSYLSGLWKGNTENDKRKVWRERDEKLTRYFLIVLASVVISTALVWSFIEPRLIVIIITSVLIVACPCALALSAPFTFGNVQRKLANKGLFLKDSYYIPELAEITDIVFDKTGTLTTTEHTVIYSGKKLKEDQIVAVYSLCNESGHPYSKAIVRHHSISNDGFEVEDFKEIPGEGIEGKVNGIHYLIKSYKEKSSASAIWIDGILMGYYSFSSLVENETLEVLKLLQKNYTVHILSGDGPKDEKIFSPIINKEYMHFGKSPFEKEAYIQNLQNSGAKVAMLGDGINDTAALIKADIGFALSDTDHQFTPTADGILQRQHFALLPQILNYSKYSIKVLQILYGFSLLYNVIGLYFAVTHQLTPLVAAIIMPLSSITIVSIATIMSRIYKLKTGLITI